MEHIDKSGLARQIAEDFLERTRVCLLTGEFDLFQACFALPHRTETFAGVRELTTIDDIRRTFVAVRQYYTQLGVDEIHRTCLAAGFMAERRLAFTCETRLLNGQWLVQDPYPIYSIAELRSGDWRIVQSTYAITDNHRHNKALGLEAFPNT